MITDDDLINAGKIALPLVSASIDSNTIETFNNHASPFSPQKIQGSTGAASWDTGTQLAIVSYSLLDALADAIPGSKRVGSKPNYGYSVPCSLSGSETSGPIVSLSFSNGVKLSITANEYIWKSGESCYLALQAQDGGYRAGTYLIGNTFLKRYVNIFDYEKKRVGLVLAKGRGNAATVEVSANNNAGNEPGSKGNGIRLRNSLFAAVLFAIFLY